MRTSAAIAIVVLLLEACSGQTSVPPQTGSSATRSAQARVTDPVCGMKVDPMVSPREEVQGRMFYFCSEACEEEFKKSPAAFVRPVPGEAEPPVK